MEEKLVLRFFFWLVFLCLGAVSVRAASLSLPEVPGWRASLPDFVTYKSSLTKAFYIKRRYEGQKGAWIEVLFAGGSEGKRLLEALKGRFELETRDYYLRYLEEDGYRLFATYHRREQAGVLAVFLSKDPVLVLMARYEGLSDKEALSWLKALNWGSLKEKGLSILEEERRSGE